MLNCSQQTDNNSHVQALDIGSQLVWGELLFVCDVEIEVSRYGTGYLFHVVHLLVETPNQEPQLLVIEPTDQRVGHAILLLVPAQVGNIFVVVVHLRGPFLLVVVCCQCM